MQIEYMSMVCCDILTVRWLWKGACNAPLSVNTECSPLVCASGMLLVRVMALRFSRTVVLHLN
uniref:Uncharacterized protein n=1 Tax=Anguilla anguilla TaxID=7936 RepID=A0A0E9S816_ANGAN